MKTILTILAFVLLTVTAKAQEVNVTNSPTGSANLLPTNTVYGGLQEIAAAVGASGLLQATNYAIEPYVTYAPSALHKVGGGVLILYDLNNFVAMGIGGDYLGRFTMISANATLKLPIHPLQNVTWAPTLLRNVTVTPFTLVGAGIGVNGSGSGILIQDTGAAIAFGHLYGGRFNVGATYGQWLNAGQYSGKRYHLFAGWSHDF